jgi:hypothetical protein
MFTSIIYLFFYDTIKNIIITVHSACPSHSVSSAEACYWTVPIGTETNVINSCQADGGLLASITDLSVIDFLITNYNITLNKRQV